MTLFLQGLHLVESFYSNSPPVRSHGKVSKTWYFFLLRVLIHSLFGILFFQFICLAVRSFVPSSLRPFVPSSLRPFVPSSLRPFVSSSLLLFVPSFLRSFALPFLCPLSLRVCFFHFIYSHVLFISSLYFSHPSLFFVSFSSSVPCFARPFLLCSRKKL